MQRSCLFICSVLGTHPISCAICVSVVICINFHRKKKKKKNMVITLVHEYWSVMQQLFSSSMEKKKFRFVVLPCFV